MHTSQSIKYIIGTDDEEIVNEVHHICLDAYLEGLTCMPRANVNRINELDYFLSTYGLWDPVRALYNEARHEGAMDRDIEIFINEVA